jgi:asparagine synthase (glutamine-hydrolysing)
MLSGAGGDEGATYNGTAILAEMLRLGRWTSLQRELRARAHRLEKPVLAVAARDLIVPALPPWLLNLRRRLRRLDPPARRRNALSFLHPVLAAQVAEAIPAEERADSTAHTRMKWWTGNYLTVRSDGWSILGARHGVAFSYPLADRRIVEFALSLPVEHLVDRGFSRQPYRNAMAGILPESIRWRDSKFVPFPDKPQSLSAAAATLAARVDRLRGSAAADFVNMDAVASALLNVPPQEEAQRLAVLSNTRRPMPRSFKMAVHATRALILGEYVARMTRSF